MHGPTIDVTEELTALGRALDAYDALRSELGAREHEVAPAVSGWSAAQHLYHIALATDLALGHVRALCEGKGRLITAEGELGARAAAVLVSDRTERGVAEAPRMVRPGSTVDPSFLTNELAQARRALDATHGRAGAIPAAAGWIPHQELGPLGAVHWLRFARLHAEHHLAIARDVAHGLPPTA